MPLLLPDPPTLFFNGQLVGTSTSPASLTLTKVGAAPLSITSITASPNFTITSSTCGGPVGTCSVGVQFTPTARGSTVGTLTITTNAGIQQLALFGIGLDPQAITLGPAPEVAVGGTGILTATGGASGNPVTFSSANPAICTVGLETGIVTGLSQGTCVVVAEQAGNYEYAAAPQAQRQVLVTDSRAVGTRLTSISTRAGVETGDGVTIGGFIIEGSVPKTVVINARGPSMFGTSPSTGVANPLANPKLALVAPDGTVMQNDNWEDAPNAATIRALGMNPPHPLESSILATLAPGGYTAIVSGVQDSTGIGLVEIFELDVPQNPFSGISTRGLVQGGDKVLIGGFVISGKDPQTVVIRARGRSLGVDGALGNPTLTLVPPSGGNITNDDWASAANAATLAAMGYAPGDPQESALLVTLNPGAYTAIVSGVGGATGTAIVEIYRLE
jgi:hypothetical protein